MAVISSFSETTLIDLFKNNLKLNYDNLKYHIKQCKRNEKILCLKLASENEETNRAHVMIKMLNSEGLGKKKIEYAKSLENVFTVKDDNNDVFLGFLKKGTLYPYKNNIEHLEIIIKNLAKYQVNYLAETGNSKTTKNSEYLVNKFSDAVIGVNRFKELDKAYINDVILKLQKSVDDLFKNGPLVTSVGNIFANNVFITAPSECIFLDLGHEVFRSPLYDVIIFIFALSDENFRQHHLKSLLSLYYRQFIELLKEVNENMVNNFDLNDFERHVKIILSIVKFETAAYLIQKEKTIQEKKDLEELLKNILYSLKYQQVSYEDCLEAASKKVKSTDFKLINYELVPLDQRNGHLGQYFNLKFKILFCDKTQEFSLFTKILGTDNSHMTSIIQSGPSMKEQFFFRTLIPLFKKYGLESLVDFAPNCYFDRLNEVVILDDLAELGYKSFTNNARIGYDVLKSAFLNAAKLHASTLILENRMSKNKATVVRLGDTYKKYMEDWLFEKREGLPGAPVCVTYSRPGLNALIDSFEDISTVIPKDEFQKRVDSIFEVFLERINSPAKQFRNVVCQGDLYASNMLVKYNENGISEDCIIVDYQGLRYAPIAEDILMLAYFSTTKDVRDKYLDKLLEEYYEEIKKIMSEFDLDISTFYTPKDFKECVKYMKPVVIIAAVFYGQLMALSPEKKKTLVLNERNFQYYFIENRKELIKVLLNSPDDCTTYLKELIQDLYDICISSEYF